MILIPKKTKYRKFRKNITNLKASRGTYLVHGTYGLVALESYRITAQQIEACRKAIMRQIKRIGKLWIRIFPHFPVTAKPSKVRMGQGKGSFEYWMFRVKQNHVLFELTCYSSGPAQLALKHAAGKLPIRTKIIQK